MTGLSALKKVVGLVAREYWNGWLYAVEPQRDTNIQGNVHCREIEDLGEIAKSRFEEIRRQAWKKEEGTAVFGAWMDEELVGVCWFHSGQTYLRHGGLFPLDDGEAELAQITTAPDLRGRGVATQLIQSSARQMGAWGYTRLYARIWRGNLPSIRAFERAGWRMRCRFVSVHWRGLTKPVIYKLPVRRHPRQTSE